MKNDPKNQFPQSGESDNPYIETLERTPLAKDATLRDYFAAKAMQGILASYDPGIAWKGIEADAPKIAKVSHAIADAMLSEREKTE